MLVSILSEGMGNFISCQQYHNIVMFAEIPENDLYGLSCMSRVVAQIAQCWRFQETGSI